MALAYGLDVSKWDQKVDWQKIAQQGFSFVFIKCSQADFEDGMFQNHWSGAKSAGLLRGAYHFLVQGLEARKQAQAFVKFLGDDTGELPPVVDVEVTPGVVNQSPAALAKVLKAYLTEVENSLGVRPIIYTSGGFWNGALPVGKALTEWARNYDLWVANFITIPSVNKGATLTVDNMNTIVESVSQGKFKPFLPNSWQKWLFWQCSGEAYFLDGLETFNAEKRVLPMKVDINVFNGTLEDLRSRARIVGGSAPPEEKPKFTNQAMINAFFRAFGKDEYFKVITRCDLAFMADDDKRGLEYSGPAVDKLSLTDSEKSALKAELPS